MIKGAAMNLLEREGDAKSLDIRENEEETLSIEQVVGWLIGMDRVGAGLKEMAIGWEGMKIGGVW